MHNNKNYGFDPFYEKCSKILILGSFPSVKSREVGFYYGNSQNRFWKMLSSVFNEKLPNSVEEKKEILKKHNIALFDVYSSSSILGSADADINDENSRRVDLISLLKKMPQLKIIISNGKKSFEVVDDILFGLNYNYIYLSSTSSANPRYNFNDWKKVILENC